MKIFPHHQPGMDRADNYALCGIVDRAAAILGVRPVDDNHYTATRTFTGGTEYEVCHIPSEWARTQRAQRSHEANAQVTS